MVPPSFDVSAVRTASIGGVIASSYLRVYEPITSFSRADRARWAEPVDTLAETERAAGRKWLLSGSMPEQPVLPPQEGAFVRVVGDQKLICPWRTQLRMLAGMLAFRGSVPEEVADAFVTEEEARRAAHVLAELGEDHPEIRSHILHANWHVPLRWFVPFDENERLLTEDKEGLRIRYESNLPDARARLERAVTILETSWIDSGVTEAVKELLAWLEGFDDGGLLELDYGSVAAIFTHDDLLEDRSVAHVWVCLDALAAGDVVRAGEMFADLTDRWTEVRAREVVN